MPRIDGVQVRAAVTIPDERGTLTEMFNPAWNFGDEVVMYAYQFTIHPGKVKGWAVHYETDDRYFHSLGMVKLVLFDNRPESPTYKMINELFFTEFNRSHILIPKNVYHAIQNVGTTEAILVNFPSKVYDRANPDKYRLGLENDLIPYHFDQSIGG